MLNSRFADFSYEPARMITNVALYLTSLTESICCRNPAYFFSSLVIKEHQIDFRWPGVGQQVLQIIPAACLVYQKIRMF